MRRVSVVEGVRWGLVLAACAIVLGILGLTPSLAWIPEVALLGAGVLIPLLVLAIAGSRAGSRSGRAVSGSAAGALAGAVGGLAGGLCYLAYGKPALNLAVGVLAGTAAGALIGGPAGLVGRRRALRRQPANFPL